MFNLGHQFFGLYTHNEYFDMSMCLGAGDGNPRRAAEIYAQRYAGIRLRFPDFRVVERLRDRMWTRGTFLPSNPNAGRPAADFPELQALVLEAVEAEPQISTRLLAVRFGASPTLIHKILTRNGYYPYHYQRVQEMTEGQDYDRRLNFAAGFLAQQRNDRYFNRRILWTDECTFTRSGVFNSKNFVHWADHNPRVIRQTNFQRMWSINVWAGMIGNVVVRIVLFTLYYKESKPISAIFPY